MRSMSLPRQRRVGGQVHVAVLVAAQPEVHLGDAGAQGAHEHRAALDLADVPGPLGHAREAPGSRGSGQAKAAMSAALMAPSSGALLDFEVQAADRPRAHDAPLVDEALELAVGDDLAPVPGRRPVATIATSAPNRSSTSSWTSASPWVVSTMRISASGQAEDGRSRA